MAEVIIVIGTIGIIAELTIPSLAQNTREAQIKSGVKVAYSLLSQASSMAVNDNGGSLTNLWSNVYDNVALKNVMTNYLRINKDCGGTSGSTQSSNTPIDKGCWVTKTALDGTTANEFNEYAGIILSNGMYLVFRAHDSSCSISNICGWVMVDVNGSKPPNILGKDSFFFYYKENGTVGVGGDPTIAENNVSGDPNTAVCTGSESGVRSGWGCTYKTLYGN